MAVDWVLPKDKYMANQSNKTEGTQSMDIEEEKTQFTGISIASKNASD